MFIVFKRKNLVLIAAMLMVTLTAMAAIGATSSASVYFGASTRKVPVYCVETSEKVIAFTFDAAWGADKTQGIIEILNQNEISATFFLVGFWIDKFENEVKMIKSAGLDIGNHSENHLNMSKLSPDEAKKEIKIVNDKIFALTGDTPTYFRAPYGDYDNELISAVEEMGMVGVQWSIDTLDWKGLTASQICERILPKAKSGDIVLFHNNSEHVLDALPVVIAGLKNKGFKFVRLSELVAVENYYVDSQGVQHPKS